MVTLLLHRLRERMSWLRLVTALALTVGMVFPINPLPGQGLADAGKKASARGNRTVPEAAEESLPSGALARMGTSRFRPGEIVYSVALSPDGQVVAAGSYNSAVRLWDTTTGKELHCLDGHRWDVYLAFAPDGKTLAAGS